MSEEVKEMFASISGRYDRVNTILSLGVHHYWRKVAVGMSRAEPGLSVLDCATGTGDLAFEFKKAVGVSGYVLGTDFTPEMLEYAPQKAKDKELDVQFELADALNLPYEAGRFDIASIAFGIRNVDDPVLCLKEMARVVRSGGRVVVLEFGQPRGVLGGPYRWYSRKVMPVLGGMLSGNRAAYTYLPETSAAFPAGDKFLSLMDQSDVFSKRFMRSLTGGVAYVYVGVVK